MKENKCRTCIYCNLGENEERHFFYCEKQKSVFCITDFNDLCSNYKAKNEN